MNYTLDSRFAIVDLETTGTTAHSDRIIEIGIVVVENREIVTTLKSFINPEKAKISPFIFALTGIVPRDLVGAPTFFSKREEIAELLEDAVFVAHNARFDYGFIKREFERVGINFKAPTLCSVKLSRALFPQFKRHNLDEVIARSGIKVANRHRAYDDAKAVWDFMMHLETKFDRKTIDTKIHQLIKGAIVPSQLSDDIIENLPELPGVYQFHGEKGEILYVGKSVNIKERVHSHFRDTLKSGKEMHIFNRVRNIEVEVTTGEFSALMLETRRIKELRPIYNRKLQGLKKVTVIKKKENEHGYLTAEICLQDEITADEAPEILGIYKSKKQAEAALLFASQMQQLCRGLLGIEKLEKNKPCFLYQLSKCKGACIKEELPIIHNMRFSSAFDKTRIVRWPYPSAILIEETTAPDTKGRTKTEVFIINNWCIIAHGHSMEDSTQFEHFEPTFDYDTYQILASHILKKKIRFKLVRPDELTALMLVN